MKLHEVKKIFVFGYDEIQNNLRYRRNVEEDIKQLRRFDEILVKLEDAFGVQLAVMVVSYTLTFVFHVSFLILKLFVKFKKSISVLLLLAFGTPQHQLNFKNFVIFFKRSLCGLSLFLCC